MLLSSPHPSAPNIQIGFADLIRIVFSFFNEHLFFEVFWLYFGHLLSFISTYCSVFQCSVNLTGMFFEF